MPFGRPPAPPPAAPQARPDPHAATLPMAQPPIASPPRPLLPELWLHLLLGTTLARAGWGLVIAGALVLAAMAPYTDVIGLLPLPNAGVTVGGLVQEATETDWSDLELQGGGRIYANRFLYTPPGGATLENVSYSTGRAVAAGDQVVVEYSPGNPRRARIQGQRYRPLGRSSAALLLPSLVGLGLAGLALWNGRSHARLLSRGRVALAVLRHRGEVTDRRGRLLRWNLEFAFLTPEGEVVEILHPTRDPGPLTDGGRELVFYDPAQPEKGVLFDALPGGPLLDGDGSFQVSRPVSAWMATLLPALGVILSLGTAWYLLSGVF